MSGVGKLQNGGGPIGGLQAPKQHAAGSAHAKKLVIKPLKGRNMYRRCYGP
jgi:hypothetical protein